MRAMIVAAMIAVGGSAVGDERDAFVWKSCDASMRAIYAGADDRTRSLARQQYYECISASRSAWDREHAAPLPDEMRDDWPDDKKCAWWERELERYKHRDSLIPASERGGYPNIISNAVACAQDRERARVNAFASEHADDAALVPISASAALCTYEERMRATKAQLAEEKAVTKIGGVVNVDSVYELATDVRNLGALIRQAKATIAKMHKKRTPCSDPFIGDVANCQILINANDAACSDPHVHEVAALYSLGL